MVYHARCVGCGNIQDIKSMLERCTRCKYAGMKNWETVPLSMKNELPTRTV